MQDFAYHRPLSLEGALSAIAADGARALAGGTDLVTQLREGRRRAAHLVDLKGIGTLKDIAVHPDGGVTIGAAVSATAISRHPHILLHFPAVASACRLIGSWQIQNRATLGGNVCNAAPSADGIPPLLCHGTVAHIASADGRRVLPLEALFAGPGRTHLAAGEIVTGLHVPAPPPRSAATYMRFTPRREMDIAVAGAGAWLHLDADGRISAARIALASVAPTPIRAVSAERSLRGQTPSRALLQAATAAAAGEAQPISDTRGSANYRRHLVAILTQRALMACLTHLNVSVEGP